jgi:hypothetical protein
MLTVRQPVFSRSLGRFRTAVRRPLYGFKPGAGISASTRRPRRQLHHLGRGRIRRALAIFQQAPQIAHDGWAVGIHGRRAQNAIPPSCRP